MKVVQVNKFKQTSTEMEWSKRIENINEGTASTRGVLAVKTGRYRFKKIETP